MTALVVLAAVIVAELATLGGWLLYRSGRQDPTVTATSDIEPERRLSGEEIVAHLMGKEDPRTAPAWYRDLLMEVIIVHSKSGLSYEGLCVLVWDDGLMLRNAKILDEKRSPTPMAGEFRIGVDKIEGIQTKPAELESLPTPA